MKEINLFREMLQPHLQWNAARLAFVSTFLIALMRVKTVNLAEIATGFSGGAKVASHYKRLQRFFREFEVDYEAIALMVVKVMKIPEPWVISIDRTDWQFGKSVFNVLTLGIVHQGVAFPIVWTMLDKKGNSDTHERSELLNRFLHIFADSKIDFITADREFVGGDWFDYLLHEPSTRFRIRIRKNTLLDDGQKQLRAEVCFQDLQVGQSKVLSKPRQIWGHWLYVAALRLDDGELLIVVTDYDPDAAIADYAKRWAIETLFGCFKTRGFCLESTHLQDSKRLSKLIALLTLALCWAFSSGLWLAQLCPLKPKKHGRLPKSIFRLGFDFLRHFIFDLHLNFDEFFKSIQFLSCT
jgi:Transposase DDE domain